MCNQPLLIHARVRFDDNTSSDQFTQPLVWYTDSSGFDDGGVRVERVFDGRGVLHPQTIVRYPLLDSGRRVGAYDVLAPSNDNIFHYHSQLTIRPHPNCRWLGRTSIADIQEPVFVLIPQIPSLEPAVFRHRFRRRLWNTSLG